MARRSSTGPLLIIKFPLLNDDDVSVVCPRIGVRSQETCKLTRCVYVLVLVLLSWWPCVAQQWPAGIRLQNPRAQQLSNPLRSRAQLALFRAKLPDPELTCRTWISHGKISQTSTSQAPISRVPRSIRLISAGQFSLTPISLEPTWAVATCTAPI